MQNIQPVTIWNNGQLETATQLEVVSVYDNLATTADLRYTLYTEDMINVSSERLTISGDDYVVWGESEDINISAYQWVANRLNIILDFTPKEDSAIHISTEEIYIIEPTNSIDTSTEESNILVIEEPAIINNTEIIETKLDEIVVEPITEI